MNTILDDNKQIQEELRKSEERWKFALEGAGDGVWDYNLQTHEVFYSKRYQEMYGLVADENGKVHHEWKDCVHPDDMPRLLKNVKAYLEGNLPNFAMEYRMLCSDGSWKWILDRAMLVSRTEDGKPLRMIGTHSDITKHKQMEETLISNEAFTTSILNSLTSHIAVLDDQGAIVAVNRAWRLFNEQNSLPDVSQNMLGFNYLDVCVKTSRPKNCDTCKGCEEADEILQGIKAVMARELPEFDAEYPCHSPTEQRWFYMRVLPLQGVKQGVVISHENITERKQMELDLRIAAVAFQSQEPIVITDKTNVILRINKALTESTGYSEQEAVGQKISLLKSGRHDEAFYEAMWEHILSTGTWQGEVWDRRKNGDCYPKWLSITGVRDIDGTITHYVGIHTDVTEHKRREEEIKRLSDSTLNKAKLEAEKANLAKSDFLSSMSHELRTPMNAVLGFAQLLEFEDLTEDQHNSVNHILTAGHHLLELINQVLDLSKIESENLDLNLKKITLATLMEDCLSLVKPLALKNDIEIIDYISSRCHCEVVSDSLRLKQVLLNLISNAIKYNRAEGSSITISCEQTHPQAVKIKITDTGNGLPENQLFKLFQPFERLSAKNSNIGGTGIGLCISKKLIEAMNGTIGVSSVEGEGSCFWVEIPLA